MLNNQGENDEIAMSHREAMAKLGENIKVKTFQKEIQLICFNSFYRYLYNEKLSCLIFNGFVIRYQLVVKKIRYQ